MAAKKQTVSFDQSLAQLDQIVRQLEMGNLPLEEAISLYKEGMNLSATCHQKLQTIEHEVALLVDANANVTEFTVNEES